MIVIWNELYCYKDPERVKQVIMHTLVGTYVQELKEMEIEDEELNNLEGGGLMKVWPLKIIIPPSKSRMLFFTTLADQLKWAGIFRKQIGSPSV